MKFAIRQRIRVMWLRMLLLLGAVATLRLRPPDSLLWPVEVVVVSSLDLDSVSGQRVSLSFEYPS
jgi:hypothetical protein